MIWTIISLLISTATIGLMVREDKAYRKVMGKGMGGIALLGYAFALIPIINVIYFIYFIGNLFDE